MDLPQQLRANIDRGLGSVQAFADPARDRTVVLITTTAAWNMVDPLLDYIDGLENGWPQLTGDVLAAGAAGYADRTLDRAQAEPVESSGLGLWGLDRDRRRRGGARCHTRRRGVAAETEITHGGCGFFGENRSTVSRSATS